MEDIGKRRGWHDIIAEILKTANQGTLKTHIALKVGLTHDQMKRYLRFLIDEGLIQNLTIKRRKLSIRLYRTTQKGLKLMEILEFMRKLEDSPSEKCECREIKHAPTCRRENE